MACETDHGPTGSFGPLAALVEIPGAVRPLDGLWYEPPGAARGGVVLSHGNTMNFAVGAPRFLPPALVPSGFACLAFNRRSHDILSTRDSRRPVGGAFQTARTDREDTDSAVRFVRDRGFARPIMIGHSNGGMLTAAHAASDDAIRAVVLLSAHGGGKDTVANASLAGHLAADELESALERARMLVDAGEGDHLLLLPGWWYVTSAESLLDRLTSTPDLLAAATSIDCPVLYVVGDREAPSRYPARAFADASPGRCDVVVIADCGHFYNDREAEITVIVRDWLDDVCPPSTPQTPETT